MPLRRTGVDPVRCFSQATRFGNGETCSTPQRTCLRWQNNISLRFAWIKKEKPGFRFSKRFLK
jgi:hypothetical protein